MGTKPNTGINPSDNELQEVDRIASLHPSQQKTHPSAVLSDAKILTHINSYAALPEYYIDRSFVCRKCGKREIWRAKDQKWYYEEAKGHVDARAVECHDCRVKKKRAKSAQ